MKMKPSNSPIVVAETEEFNQSQFPRIKLEAKLDHEVEKRFDSSEQQLNYHQ